MYIKERAYDHLRRQRHVSYETRGKTTRHMNSAVMCA